MELLSVGQHGMRTFHVVPFKPFDLDRVEAIITGLV